jgi:type I restriction enzyme S subunit
MAGRYQAYPEYKDSGVEWIENIPVHWEIRRTKAMFFLSRKLVGKKSKDYQLLSLTLKGVVHRDISDGGGKIPAEFDSYQEVCPNDLIFCLFDIDETPRTVGISFDYGMITGAYNVYKCLDVCVPEYAYYYFLHIDSFKGLKPFYTGLRKVVRADTFSNIKIPAPSVLEQTQIANFLDYETAKIDTLIEKQQKLIQLLKEKRQAVISHAVTKGLNPNAPMRDSGVEWLGEVPESWKLKNYRYATKIYRGKFGHRPRNDPALYDGVYPFIQTGDIARADKKITTYSQTLNARGIIVSQKFPAGSLVMAIAANIGDTAILDFEAYAPDSVVGFKPNKDIYLEFLRYSLMAALPALVQVSTQSAQANLNIDRISTVKAIFPPLDEQIEIVNMLDSFIERYRDIEMKAIEAIELMQERRTALISAAVTGKIDVRNWQPPKTDKSEAA